MLTTPAPHIRRMNHPGCEPARSLEHAPFSHLGRVLPCGQHHHPGADPRRRRRTKSLAVFAAGALVLAGFAVVEQKSGPTKPLPPPVVRRSQRLGAVAWPGSGESAADISGVGLVPGPGAKRRVPIASVAKVMTAYVILGDHPLAVGASGPLITVRPEEAAAYASEARDGDSLVRVTGGELITERQALEALLLPSADNMAWILARWDARSQGAFVARMNTTARHLGMTATTYTDPSGLDASTTSTADDQARLGRAAMRVPALVAIAGMRTADIPVAGGVRNYNTLLGQDGISGLKTGSTGAAGGCILLAAWHQAGARKALVIAATLGQPGSMQTMLGNALQAGHALVLSLDDAVSGQRHGSRGPADRRRSGWPPPERPGRGQGRLGRAQPGRVRLHQTVTGTQNARSSRPAVPRTARPAGQRRVPGQSVPL
jgi:D-alanyl-D-alanine carboxypeptidase